MPGSTSEGSTGNAGRRHRSRCKAPAIPVSAAGSVTLCSGDGRAARPGLAIDRILGTHRLTPLSDKCFLRCLSADLPRKQFLLVLLQGAVAPFIPTVTVTSRCWDRFQRFDVFCGELPNVRLPFLADEPLAKHTDVQRSGLDLGIFQPSRHVLSEADLQAVLREPDEIEETLSSLIAYLAARHASSPPSREAVVVLRPAGGCQEMDTTPRT